LFIASFLSSFILHKNQNIFEELTILSLYITMIADIGGNVGSQAATVVIRALSLKQININNFFSIIFKETKIGILLSLCLFCLAFLKVILLSKNMELNNYNLYNIAFIIALSSGLQVITATLVGTSLPFLIKWFKGDPAVAASPAITTIVDTSGMLIYFTIIMIFLTKS
jgi:magnesium transporter